MDTAISSIRAKLKNNKSVLKVYLKIKFFGFKYICPFCHGHFNRFFSAGFDFPVLYEKKVIAAGLRNNVRCPKCNSSNRERLIYLYLKNETDFLNSPNEILHIAPEENLQKELLKLSQNKYISIDLDSHLAQYRMDITNLQFSDKKFDLVICRHVLEHVKDDLLAMSEIYRALKPGGLAIVLVPIAKALEKTYEDFSISEPEDKIKHFGQNDHVRIYAVDIVDRLKILKFKVEMNNYADKMKEKLIKKYSLDKEEILFLCKK